MDFKTKTMMTMAAVAVLSLAGAACSKSGAGQLSVSAQAVTSADTGAADAGASSGSLDLGQGISVSNVQFVVKRITLHLPELESLDGGGDGGTDSDGGTDDSSSLVTSRSSADQGRGESEIEDESEDDEVKIGPFLVDLSGDALANQTLTKVFDSADVLAGTFREIKIVIAPVDSLVADGSSVTISGTLDGGTADAKEFTFKSSLHAAHKIESEVTVSEDGSQNVTLTIDPSGWFKDSAGNRLDPTDPSNKSQIENNIKRSIKGFCDRDRDGEDDSGERGGDSGPGRS
jgi:hypothetical protein